MPRLWNDTIDAHHEAVSDAIFAATAAIISGEGFGALSMARIAQRAGIGRATLYKYFSDLDAVLAAWHERAVSQHLHHVQAIASSHDDPWAALRLTLLAYGNMSRRQQDHRHAALLHSLPHVAKAHDQLHAHVRTLVQAAATAGSAREDVPADELAGFALAAIDHARAARSDRAVERTVDLILKAIGV
jgi:AcrR family transcriptional regulator